MMTTSSSTSSVAIASVVFFGGEVSLRLNEAVEAEQEEEEVEVDCEVDEVVAELARISISHGHLLWSMCDAFQAVSASESVGLPVYNSFASGQSLIRYEHHELNPRRAVIAERNIAGCLLLSRCFSTSDGTKLDSFTSENL